MRHSQATEEEEEVGCKLSTQAVLHMILIWGLREAIRLSFPMKEDVHRR